MLLTCHLALLRGGVLCGPGVASSFNAVARSMYGSRHLRLLFHSLNPQRTPDDLKLQPSTAMLIGHAEDAFCSNCQISEMPSTWFETPHKTEAGRGPEGIIGVPPAVWSCDQEASRPGEHGTGSPRVPCQGACSCISGFVAQFISGKWFPITVSMPACSVANVARNRLERVQRSGGSAASRNVLASQASPPKTT